MSKLKFIDETDNRVLSVSKCKRPSFKEVRGRCWDYGVGTIDGEKVQFWLDTVFGEYVYFIWNGQYYKTRMSPVGYLPDNLLWNFDPFGLPKLITKSTGVVEEPVLKTIKRLKVTGNYICGSFLEKKDEMLGDGFFNLCQYSCGEWFYYRAAYSRNIPMHLAEEFSNLMLQIEEENKIA